MCGDYLISFREVTEGDFKKLYIWRNLPHVKEFWDPHLDLSYEDIAFKYSKRLEEGKIKIYIIMISDKDIGYIQTYFISDLSSFKISGITKGIDLYIGEADFLHIGLGKDILREFIQKYVFNDKSVEYAAIDPEVDNKIAIKAYKKAGFEHVNTAYNEIEKLISYYMVMSRDKFFCNL